MFLKPELSFTKYRVVFSLEQVFTTASYIANRYSVGIRNMNLSSVPEDIIILNYKAQVDAGRERVMGSRLPLCFLGIYLEVFICIRIFFVKYTVNVFTCSEEKINPVRIIILVYCM